MSTYIRSSEPPTPEQCSLHAAIHHGEAESAFACWHFQWGGYCGLSVVEVAGDVGGCFDVFVWHDGEFPRNGEPPRKFHYCNPVQLIEFGLMVLKYQQLHNGRKGEATMDDDLREELAEIRNDINDMIGPE